MFIVVFYEISLLLNDEQSEVFPFIILRVIIEISKANKGGKLR